MDYNISENIIYCQEFVSSVSGLLYYSHATSAIVSILISLFVYLKNKDSILGKILLSFSIAYSLWIYFNFRIWTGYESGGMIMFAWAPIEIFSILLFFLAFYFIYVFIEQKDIPFSWKLISASIITPVIIFGPTLLHLETYDIQECIASEGSLYMNYVRIIKIMLSFLIIGFTGYKLYKYQDRRFEISLLVIGIITFLYSFFIASIIAENTFDYRYEFYGLFGMMVFVTILTYLIVTRQVLNIKLISSQALVISLIVLVGSQLFFVRNIVSIVLSIITLLFTTGFGYFLIRSVKKEVETREYAESLTKALTESNDKLYAANLKLKELDRQKTEFVSIASHQLRAPLTAIKGYSSMLLEGSFGQMPDKSKEAIDVIFQSSQKLVTVIEDFLNVTRIELGRMKYEMTVFDIRDLTEKIIEELMFGAKKKNLKLNLESNRGAYQVYADYGKINQVITNVIDNAIKYTPKGEIDVKIYKPENDPYHIRIEVKDQGVGIDPQSIPKLFQKFIRADEVGKTHISGTGLGLYVAKQIMEAHKGKIWVESEGEGKGSTFYIEILEYGAQNKAEEQKEIESFADSI